ncbi:hypothetical protein [Streptomyces cuspidosporus]|uniref:hypothetical protein n=1 Tax=Streptomyces cuspidosporus TaxID=66882 RepID=UPI0031FE4196
MADDTAGLNELPFSGPEEGLLQEHQESPGLTEPLSDDSGPHPRAEGVERSEPDEREEDGKGYDDLRRVLGQQIVHNNFYASVDASGAAFGFGMAAAPGLAPGSVTPSEIDKALRYFLPPLPCFDEAFRKLDVEHIVVLVGQDNSGRTAGSFALLRKAMGTKTGLRSLSPANSLADLAASRDIKTGQAYVILDYVGETHVDAVQAFGIRRLSEELRGRGSYLVITASEATRRRLALRDYCVPWHAPDPLELFHHCNQLLSAPVPPDLAEELLQHVKALRRPADVIAAATGLADGPDVALKALRDSDRELVRKWFHKEPSAEDLLPLAALAFLEGVPERTFEQHSVQLSTYVRDWEQAGELPVAEPDGAATTARRGVVFKQTRARWKEQAVGLVRTERRAGRGQDSSRSERRIVFHSPRIRELVIGELHDLYGYELWYPLRQWLGRLSLVDDLDVRTEVARGISLLARHALVEVEENFLQSWAGGITSQRVTTALTLQFMCQEPHLAPQALNVALGWADRRGPERAVTSAMALTGRIGSLYRLEALNWLWFLTHRGERVASAARRSLVLLLQTGEQEPDRAVFMLRYVRTRIAGTARRSTARSHALRAAVQLLEAEQLEGAGPLPAALLQHVSASARHLGSLWTSVLLSVCRRRAVGALCRTLVALRDDPSGPDLVRNLGEAMRMEMNSRQWDVLRKDLSTALNHPDYAIPGTRQLARVLIGSLRS